METYKLTAFTTSTIEVRPVELRDEGYIRVNQHHFALEAASVTDVSPVLQEGVNILDFIVTVAKVELHPICNQL